MHVDPTLYPDAVVGIKGDGPYGPPGPVTAAVPGTVTALGREKKKRQMMASAFGVRGLAATIRTPLGGPLDHPWLQTPEASAGKAKLGQ